VLKLQEKIERATIAKKKSAQPAPAGS